MTRTAGRLLGVAILVAALALGLGVMHLAYREPRTDDATVRANVVGIAPHVSGPIVTLNVVDNQEVAEGDVLFVIDPRPYEITLERERAALLLAESEVAATTQAIESATAEVARLEAERDYAHDYRRRLEPLLPKRFVTRDRFDEATVKARAADAAVQKARRDLDRQRKLLAQYGEENAHVAAARAALRAAELDLGYCTVRAPFPARVTNLNIARGEYALAGQRVFALVDTRAWYVLANFQETYLDSIRPGMGADVYLMSYPGRLFRGTVQGIGWAVLSQDERNEGVLPAVRPSLNWVRLAQRIPVRIELEPPDPAQPYRMGMTAVVTIRGDGPSG